MRIGLATINPTVGDFPGNKEKILEVIREAQKKNCHLVIFPELVTTGYPPKDLLFRKEFIRENEKLAREIISQSKGIGIIFGWIERVREEKLRHWDKSFFPEVLSNSALFVHNQKILGTVRKVHLPSYDVFDEKRYFQPGKEIKVFSFQGQKFGLTICEDIWIKDSVTEELIKKGAKIVINISASPFYLGKYELRKKILRELAKNYKTFVLHSNLLGGQDELIFDGGSLAFSPEGRLLAEGKRFCEELLIFELESQPTEERKWSEEEELFFALVLGIKDYVKKNGFEKVCLGLSGGIDSALTASLAVSALGRENITCLIMPGPFTQPSSLLDAKTVARNLGVKFIEIDIRKIYRSYLETLKDLTPFTKGKDTALENIQARIRGNLLMAFSNKFGHLVLACGNKPEMALGYATLYGDLVGGLAVIGDLSKELVYKLASYINEREGREIIPERVFNKPPSAELRPNQKDEEDLLPYPILDEIIKLYIEENAQPSLIVKKGFKKKEVQFVLNLIKKSEFKRKQAPIILKLTPKAFGSGWRMPITNKFKFLI